MNIKIERDQCIGCGKCAADCFCNAIALTGQKEKAQIVGERCLECGHCVAICPVNAIAMDDYDQAEVVEYQPDTFAIRPENLLNTIKFRRSTRSFKPDKVEPEKIGQIIEAGRYSPTGGNLQSVRYVVISQRLDEVRALSLETFYQIALKEAATQPAFFRPYLKRWRQWSPAYQKAGNDGLFHHAPLVIALVGSERAKIDAGIISSNMELMAHTLGLGVCYIGFFAWAGEINPAVKAQIGVAESETILTALAIGYPKHSYCRTVNRKKANITEW